MKTLALITLLATTSCVAVPIGFGVFKGSQALNENRGGEVGDTLTEADYKACQEGDKEACNRCVGYGVLLASPFHCTMWHPIHNALPTISQKKDNYGGAKYWAAQENYKGE